MKLLRVLPIVLSAVVLFSCNSEKREVERVAQAYLDAETNFKIDEARQYVDGEEMTSALNMIENFVMPNIEKSVLDSLLPNKVKIKNTEMFADTAAVVSFHSTNPKQESDAQILMRKIDGSWKVVAQGEKVSLEPQPVPQQPQPAAVPAEVPDDTLQKK